MKRLILVNVALLVSVIAIFAFLYHRIRQTDAYITVTNTMVWDTQRDLEETSRDVAQAKNDIARVDSEVAEAEKVLKDSRAELESQYERGSERLALELEEKLLRLQAVLNSVFDDVEVTSQKATELDECIKAIRNVTETHGENISETLKRTDEIARSLRRNPERMVEEMLEPSVQLLCDDGMGSGTIIYSRPDAHGRYRTYVLTVFHLLAANITKDAEGRETRRPCTVKIHDFQEDKDRNVKASIVAYNEKKDIALLRLRSSRPVKRVAMLLPASRLAAVQVFTPVYAVGCPLGNLPTPSVGELSNRCRVVDDEVMWMTNAPFTFGNSGGGIFLAETHEMIGVASRVCSYGSDSSSMVPHMGLIVPLDSIYECLQEEGYTFLFEENDEPPMTKSQ